MSDYSKIKFKKVDDLPIHIHGNLKHSGALSPVHIYDTLPFMKDMEVNDVYEFEIPADGFGYTVHNDRPNTKKWDSMRNALARSFKVLHGQTGKAYIYRIGGDNLYIKRVEA